MVSLERRIYGQEWRRQRKSAGLCKDCDQPSRPDRLTCTECGKQNSLNTAKRRKGSEYMRKWYAARKERGICRRCPNPRQPDGLMCDSCRELNCKGAVKRHRLKHYGLTQEQFDSRLEQQEHMCMICALPLDGSRGPTVVDHDHETGKVRGLLDRMCNQAIGLLGDDEANVFRALCYLQRG